MLSRLSITLRLLLLIAVPLAALLIVGLSGLASIDASRKVTTEIQGRLVREADLQGVRDSLQEMLDTVNGVLLGTADRATARDRLTLLRSSFEKARDRYSTAATGAIGGEVSAAAQLSAAFDAVLPVFTEVEIAIAKAGGPETPNSQAPNPQSTAALTSLLVNGTINTVREAISRIDTAVAAERRNAELVIAASARREGEFFFLNVGMALAGLAFALLSGYYIARSISVPVQRITATVRAVASGNLAARSRLTGLDEITGLSNALDKLLEEKVASLARAEHDNAQLNESVIGLLRAVSRLSQRDLTVRVPVTEDVTGPVADAINQLAGETSKVLTEVSRVADQVAGASAQVRSKAELVNSVTRTQQAEALDTAEKLNRAAEKLAEIANLARHCNELAQRATQNTQTAVSTVTGTLQGMTDIRVVIQETGKRIKRLGERSQEISSIVDIINKIAERTTVLALNASMQAAAAGDAGRGFGVVADEVQRLAESSRNATGQIADLVKGIQVETSDTMATMERAIAQVVDGSKLAETAGRQIGDTQGATIALVQSVQQIATGSQEQALLSVTLRDRAQAILKGVKATGDQMAEQLRDTGHLAEFARRLLESVRVFKLPV